jgi:hypothetical protein
MVILCIHEYSRLCSMGLDIETEIMGDALCSIELCIACFVTACSPFAFRGLKMCWWTLEHASWLERVLNIVALQMRQDIQKEQNGRDRSMTTAHARLQDSAWETRLAS